MADGVKMLKTEKAIRLVVLGVLLLVVLSVFACASKPLGTYTATGLFGVKETVIFYNKTLETQNALGIKQLYNYEIRKNGTEIIVTDIANGKSQVWTYKYVKEPACVIINGTSYYR